MDKKLIEFKEVNYNIFVEKAKATLKYIQQFVNDVNGINDFKVETIHLKDLLTGSGQLALQAIVDYTMQQINDAKIKSRSLINAAIEGDTQAFEKLFAQFNKPEVEIALLYLVDNGRVIIGKEELKAAKEKFCSYICTEKGIKKQQQYENFITAANEFFSNNQLYIGINLGSFFSINTDNTICKVDLDYDRM